MYNIYNNSNNNSNQVTSIEQLKTYNGGATVVELPEFGEGMPFVVKLRRPSLLSLIKTGKIPNSLMGSAQKLFASGTSVVAKDNYSIEEFYDVIYAICESALVEPTMQQLESAGIELTDEQMIAIFSYTQQGIKSLENFRN